MFPLHTSQARASSPAALSYNPASICTNTTKPVYVRILQRRYMYECYTANICTHITKPVYVRTLQSTIQVTTWQQLSSIYVQLCAMSPRVRYVASYRLCRNCSRHSTASCLYPRKELTTRTILQWRSLRHQMAGKLLVKILAGSSDANLQTWVDQAAVKSRV